jgi:hypothetical protein
MKSLRDYINIVEGTALLENPWEGKDPAKAATWAALSPEDQKFLGNADPTDQAILFRAPNKGRPTQNVAPNTQQGQQLAAQTAGMDEPASEVAGVQGSSQQDNMLAAQTAGMDAPAAVAAPGANVPNPGQPAPAQAATPAPANRDAMPFGRAFADAKAKGEKEFTWKGKKYAVAMAKPAAKPAAAPAQQAATPAAAPAQQAAAPAQQPGMWDKFKNWAAGKGQSATPATPATPAPTSMMGNIDPNTGMPENPMPESVEQLSLLKKLAGM